MISVKVAGADGVTSLEQVLRGARAGCASTEPQYDIRVLNLSLGTQGDGDYRRDFLAWAAELLWRTGSPSSPRPATTARARTCSISPPTRT